jgi:type I restriction enzyme S subunit
MPNHQNLKSGWRAVKFGDVVRLNTNRIPDPGSAGIERYVGLEHLQPEDLHIRSWGFVAEGTTFTNHFKPGQVLFGKRRAYQRKVAVADFEGVCSGDILVFEPADDRLLPELLPFICQSDGFFEHALTTSSGSLSPRTRWSDLAIYEFPLPPLDEQRRIAELLRAVDDAIADSNQISESIRILKTAIRQENFGRNHSSGLLLKDLCEPSGIQIGPFGSQLHAYDYAPEGVPVIMPADMTEDNIDETNISRIPSDMANILSRHKVIAGDILLPRRGELDRRAYIRPEQDGWLCGTGSLRIRVKKSVNSKAIFHSIASPYVVSWLKNHAVGTTMPNINTSIVSKIAITLPPDEEIDELLDILENLDEAFKLAIKKCEDEIRMKKEFLKHYIG